MKKVLLGLSIISMLFTVSCDVNGGSDSVSAPKMEKVSKLPPSGATAAPSSAAEAIDIYFEAMEAFDDGIDEDASYASYNYLDAFPVSPIQSLKGRAISDSSTTDLTQSGPLGGGTVDIKGSITTEFSMALSFGETPKPNTAYKNFYKMKMDLELKGTLTNVTFEGYYDDAYTISGEFSNKTKADFNYDVTTGNDVEDLSDAVYKIDYEYEIEYGTAFSIKREDGVGAKYIITFAASMSEKNITQENYFSKLDKEILSKKATLKVYDDSNKLLFTEEIELGDVPAI